MSSQGLIYGSVQGEAALRNFFQRAPAELQRGIRQELDRMGIDLAGRMKQKLSGQVLKVRSGRLRRSISSSGHETTEGYQVTVGTNVVYASPHEYGFKGTVTVPAHMRRVTKVFGRVPRQITQHMVRQHSMRMNIPERSFARSSLAEFQPTMVTRMEGYLQRYFNANRP